MSQDIQSLERSLAYEHATSVIETYGLAVDPLDEDDIRDWFDMTAALASDDADSITECLTYLDWRGLLLRSANNPNTIAAKDEHEAQIPAVPPSRNYGDHEVCRTFTAPAITVKFAADEENA